jgi:hypothetical protein
VLLPSGRANEVDPHFQKLMELTDKIRANQMASQELLLAHRERSDERFMGLLRDFAQSQRGSVKSFIQPVGKSCAEASIGDEARGGVVVDLPTAQTIRASKGTVGELQEFDVIVDGVTSHNRTISVVLGGDDGEIVRGDLLDPAADEWPNIYTRHIRSGRLSITGKPTLIDGKVTRIAVMDARKQAGQASNEPKPA